MSPRRSDEHVNSLSTIGLSRRRLLQAGGATLAGIWIAGSSTSPAFAATQAVPEDFAGVRERWRVILTGGDGIDPDMPEVRAVLDSLDTAVERHLARMDTSAGRTFVWPDMDFTGTDLEKSIDVRTTYERVRQLAKAYATPGAARHGDPDLLAAIIDVLDWMYEHKYNEGVDKYGNWYNFEIGAPQALNATVLLVFDDLDADRMQRYLAPVDRWNDVPKGSGSNLVKRCEIIATRAALLEDDAKLVLARDGIAPAMEIVTTGNGFYADGSYVMHMHHPYTGGYGAAALHSLSRQLYLLAGSPWALGGQGLDALLGWVTDGFEPWLHKGAFLSPVRGRAVARGSNEDHDRGQDAVHSLMWLAYSADSDRARHLNGLVKYTIEQDTVGNLFNTSELASIVRAVEIANDPAIAPAQPEIRNYQYPNMDRVVHRRPRFTFALSMSSSRIYTYESINQENLRGWHTGSGMQYVYNDDQAHYDDGFWATVDHTRLPGTTVPVGPRDPGSGADHLTDRHWVGGVADGTLGVSGMEFHTYSDTDPQAAPTGKKSWFMFDDQIAVLGAGITSSLGQPVESVVENRRLLQPAEQSLVVDGRNLGAQPWSETFHNVGWAHLPGATPASGMGYVFGDGTTLHGLRETRVGSWADVNTNPSFTDDTPIEHDYATLWFDHGVDPDDASYAYTLLPGADLEAVRRYARKPGIEVVTNTAAVQAVRRGGTFGACFWDSGVPEVSGVTCDSPAAVLVVQRGPRITVAVSDPTHLADQVRVTLRRTAKRVVFADPRVQVDQLRPSITLTFDTRDASGASIRATFEATPA